MLAVALCALAVGDCAVTPRATAVDVPTVLVDDRGDAPLLAGADECDVDPDPRIRRCTLRAATMLLARDRVDGRIELPPSLIVRDGYEPLPLDSDVTLVGEGSARTVIESPTGGPVFRAHRSGLALSWQGVSIVRPDRSELLRDDGWSTPGIGSAELPSSVALDDVLVADTRDDLEGNRRLELALSCVTGASGLSRYFRSSSISDPTAVRDVAQGLLA